jgi:hypothetical protein
MRSPESVPTLSSVSIYSFCHMEGMAGVLAGAAGCHLHTRGLIVTLRPSNHNETPAQLGVKRSCRLDRSPVCARVRSTRRDGRAASSPGHRLHQRNARAFSESDHVSINTSHVRVVLVRSERRDAGTRFGDCRVRIPGSWLLRSLHRGNRVEPGEYVLAMAGIDAEGAGIVLGLRLLRSHRLPIRIR